MNVNKQSITGKFFFSLNEPTAQLAYAKIVLGCFGETLNALRTLMLRPNPNQQIAEALKQQFEVWGVSPILEALCVKTTEQSQTTAQQLPEHLQ